MQITSPLSRQFTFVNRKEYDSIYVLKIRDLKKINIVPGINFIASKLASNITENCTFVSVYKQNAQEHITSCY